MTYIRRSHFFFVNVVHTMCMHVGVVVGRGAIVSPPPPPPRPHPFPCSGTMAFRPLRRCLAGQFLLHLKNGTEADKGPGLSIYVKNQGGAGKHKEAQRRGPEPAGRKENATVPSLHRQDAVGDGQAFV